MGSLRKAATVTAASHRPLIARRFSRFPSLRSREHFDGHFESDVLLFASLRLVPIRVPRAAFGDFALRTEQGHPLMFLNLGMRLERAVQRRPGW